VERLLAVVDEELQGGAGVAVVSHEPALFDAFEHDRIVLERGKVVDAA
jgi:ABC-type ATPase involved in cell division